ncbi:Uncharacterised protein [Staphylococcus aureus]|nr:Uncharacterised protein [Staphylococcus aureus]
MKYAIRTAIKTYAAAWALGNMYLILRHESKYQSGTSFSFIVSIISSVKPLPLRTDSIILKAIDGSRPAYIK